MDQAQPVFSTGPLLRPAQLAEARNEVKTLEEKIRDPKSGLEDRGQAHTQLRRMSKTLEAQTPLPPKDGAEEGRMVARSKELLDKILVGMPSQEEMRKAPPGAVDKHMKWEAANKSAIQEWKNLQLRLTRAEEPEAANLERHRPTSSTLLMDNAYIPGKQFHMPETTGPSVIFSDEHYSYLLKQAPEIAMKLPLLTNAQRAEVKTIVERGMAEEKQAN